MKWEEDEIDFMRVALEEGWTHKEIGNELNRTKSSVECKASKLGVKSLNNNLKTTDGYKKELPKDIEVLVPYINKKTKILHKHSCGFEWKITPNDILNGNSCPECAGKQKKTTDKYAKQIPDDIILLDKYVNSYTKILHKHSCGFKWYITPDNIIQGHSCPNCANSGFQPQKSAVTYCIYFPEHDLYKFGISNNHLQRLKQFGSKPEIIFIIEFELGLEARELEIQWSKNVDHLKINTGLLKSGNTETFRI